MRPFFILPVAAILMSTGQMTAAQDSGPPEAPRVEVSQDAELILNEINTEAYPDVAIFATVLQDGEPVLGLVADDFKVSEDEVEQSPLHVEAQLPPLSVVVTVDVSGSMSRRMEATKSAAADFIAQLGDDDAAQLVSFQREITTLTPMTTDRDSVVSAVDQLVARGDTALYDGLVRSLDLVSEAPGRKAVVLLSDGVDDDGTGKPLSEATVDEALTRAAEVNVPVFVIGLGTGMDETVLQRIASSTGGRYLAAPDAEQLAGVYDSIGTQLSGQYAVRYTSSLPADGTSRRVDLSLGDLRASKAYTAPGEPGRAMPVASGDCTLPAAIAAERAVLERANEGYARNLMSISDRNAMRAQVVRKLSDAAATPPGSIECFKEAIAATGALYDEGLISIGDRNSLREPQAANLSDLCVTNGDLESLQTCLTTYKDLYDSNAISITMRNQLIGEAATPYAEALAGMDDLDAALERVNRLYEMDAISITTRNEIRTTLRDRFLQGE